MKRPFPRWLLVLAPIVLAGLLIGALALRDVVRDAIITPLSYVAWLAGLVMRSIPQSTFWLILIAAGVLVAWRSLGGVRALFPRRAAVPVLVDGWEPSRLRARLDYLSQLGTSGFARERVAFELRGQIVAILAHRERQSPSEIEQRVHSGSLATPPEIRALLLDWQNWLAIEPDHLVEGLWLRVRRRVGRLDLPPRQTAALTARVARAIDYIDQQLD